MKELKCPNCGAVFTVDESDYAEILNQVRNDEFDRELKTREKLLKESNTKEIDLAKTKVENKYKDLLSDRDSTINEKDRVITELNAKLKAAEKEQELAIVKAVEEKNRELSEKSEEIIRLNGELKTKDTENQLMQTSLENQYKAQLKGKDEEIAFYKDFKAKQSTKMVGESLEQHCEITFNQIRATAFPNAYFEKDNDAKTGSKGDFIFRDYTDDGLEFISIMFEMKNELDTTSTKKTNEAFFKELDKDRNEKGCEFAVLVSLLEAESELYNTGIVNVSHRYPKMYVVRPQFFITIISLLRDAALKSVEYKHQLAELQSQNIDVANFEAEMEAFKKGFGKNFRLAVSHYETAIESIEKTIKGLEKTRDELKASMQQLNWANDKAEDLSIKKLTKNSPLLKEKFESL